MSGSLRWEKGDLCQVTLQGKEYDGKILDWAFSSEGNYLQIMLEYYVEYQDWNGHTQKRALIWPKPLQSYKLRKGISRRRTLPEEVQA